MHANVAGIWPEAAEWNTGLAYDSDDYDMRTVYDHDDKHLKNCFYKINLQFDLSVHEIKQNHIASSPNIMLCLIIDESSVAYV